MSIVSVHGPSMYDTHNARFIFNNWWDGDSRDDGDLRFGSGDYDPDYELLSIPSGFKVYDEEPETLFVQPGTYAINWLTYFGSGDQYFSQHVYANGLEYFSPYDEWTDMTYRSPQPGQDYAYESTLTLVLKFDRPSTPGFSWDNPYLQFSTSNGNWNYHDLTITRIDR